MSDAVIAARRQLHAVAESFLAGPQYRLRGTIRLTTRPDGIVGVATPVFLRGVRLFWPAGSAPLSGRAGALAQASGVDMGPPPASVYQSAEPLGEDTVLEIDPVAAESIYRVLHAGREAVKQFVPQLDPVLWPEHFDVGVALGEVNYGVSAGDDQHRLPYAYVGPWQPRIGAFWNAPFGALRPLDPAADADSLAAEISEFFVAAQSHL